MERSLSGLSDLIQELEEGTDITDETAEMQRKRSALSEFIEEAETALEESDDANSNNPEEVMHLTQNRGSSSARHAIKVLYKRMPC